MPQRAKVSIVVCSAMFMAGLDLFIVNLAFPRIGREFHGTSLPALSWVLTAYAIVYAALLVPAGRFADRTGRKRSFLKRRQDFAEVGQRGGEAGAVPVGRGGG